MVMDQRNACMNLNFDPYNYGSVNLLANLMQASNLSGLENSGPKPIYGNYVMDSRLARAKEWLKGRK